MVLLKRSAPATVVAVLLNSQHRTDESEAYRWCKWSIQPVDGIIDAGVCDQSGMVIAITPTEILSLVGHTGCG